MLKLISIINVLNLKKKGVKCINKVLLPYIAIALILVSCNEGGGYLLTNNEIVHLDIISVTDGELLSVNDLILFRIVTDNEEYNPEKLEIKLLTQDGDLAASTVINWPKINQNLNIKIPPLKNTQYNLVLSLYSEDALVVREKRTFFKIDGNYNINSIQSLPVVINSSSIALLIADISVPQNSNAYMRWSQEDKIIARGYLSEEFYQILWKAPQEEGVYSIGVEIFPFGPQGQEDFLFQAHDNMSAELFVTFEQSKGVQEEKEDFYNFFDIYLNSGWETNPQQILSSGITKPSIKIMGDTIVFRFDGTAGIILPEMILPIENNLLVPVTLSLGITFTEEQVSRNIITIISGNSDFSLDVFIDQHAKLGAYLKIDEQEFNFFSGVPLLELEKRYFIEFSVIPKEDTIELICRVDGEKMASFKNTFIMPDIDSTGKSIIGGENGVIGIIDTLDITSPSGGF